MSLRIEPDPELLAVDTLPRHDYVDSFAVATREARTPEQWARDVLEGAPSWLRWFVLIGWKLVLGLKLGPRNSPDHVLGWRIVSATPSVVVIGSSSYLLTAHLMFSAEPGRLVWITRIKFQNRFAPAVWTCVGLLHRPIVSYVLRRAAGRPSLTA